ncbi:hypothetical protein [Ruegeria denitrificans]|uniref:hypothetical protein n=1 Tax=Ruegeria denitrificans TaxID=1715692 RepID=UPI003C7AA0BC
MRWKESETASDGWFMPGLASAVSGAKDSSLNNDQPVKSLFFFGYGATDIRN